MTLKLSPQAQHHKLSFWLFNDDKWAVHAIQRLSLWAYGKIHLTT